jgi:hypothetical protein
MNGAALSLAQIMLVDAFCRAFKSYSTLAQPHTIAEGFVKDLWRICGICEGFVGFASCNLVGVGGGVYTKSFNLHYALSSIVCFFNEEKNHKVRYVIFVMLGYFTYQLPLHKFCWFSLPTCVLWISCVFCLLKW